MAVGFIVVASGMATSVTAQSMPPQPSYDGETLYRGLFFGSGPVAATIPTIRRIAPYLPAEYRRLEDPVVRYVRSAHPLFFRQFQTEIESGDHVRVRAMLTRAQAASQEALGAVTARDTSRFATRLRAAGADLALDQNEPGPNPNSEPGGRKRLTFERYVNEIVMAFPGHP
jgi:hypothetical protein